jgi:pimeloyl-ACP methyl ester carboxylesterase
MHPFYFGKSEQPLYGVIHNPSGGNYRNSAILLCNSVGYENIRCHKALRRLANRLSESGYYVLRFDYSGVGDSSGTFEEKDMSHWKEDILLAKEELCAISGLHAIDCVGIRLGATLACNALSDAGIKTLALLDPIINGNDFIHTLDKLQDEVINSSMWFQAPRDRNKIPDNEFLGYRYSPTLIQQLSEENIIDDSQPTISKILHLYTDQNTVIEKIPDNLNAIDFISEHLLDDSKWGQLESIDSSLIANHAIDRVIQEFL